ncbi:MAG: DNA polymerase III subunit delta [Chloroflexota bacterium]|nr:DNA polymerase III subunit delta [Chloroflexota bacterium]
MADEAILYLFHGDDDLRVEEGVEALLAPWRAAPNGDLNITTLDGITANAGEVIAAASAYPFLADRRVVLVRGLLTWITRKGAGDTGKKQVEFLEGELPALPSYTRLVLIEAGALSDANKVMKVIATLPGATIRFAAVPADSTDWIIRRAKQAYGVMIAPDAAAALASVTSSDGKSDPRRADNELIKLAAYADGRPITEADVALLTPYVSEANLFALMDALADRKVRTASALLHRLIDLQREDAFGLYGMVARQFRLLLLTKEHLANGGRTNELASAVGVKPFVADKLARQSRGFELDQLQTIYRQVGEYDYQIKTGGIAIELALDLLVASLAR